MQWKHRKLNSEANWLTSKLKKQQTEDHSTIDSTKCWKHQKENQCKANDKEFANLAEDADFTNVASHAKIAKINAEAHICAKSSSSHKRKCKCMRMQMQMNEIWLSRNSRQNHKKYHITKEDSLLISKMRTEC